MSLILVYIGSFSIILWGISHIIPTRSVVKGFGSISEDSRRILMMEWIAEGITLIFIGILTLLVALTGKNNTDVHSLVLWLSSAVLLILAVLSAFTGARTSILPMKLCPYVKTAVAFMYILGNII